MTGSQTVKRQHYYSKHPVQFNARIDHLVGIFEKNNTVLRKSTLDTDLQRIIDIIYHTSSNHTFYLYIRRHVFRHVVLKSRCEYVLESIYLIPNTQTYQEYTKA
jgi:hypothetical protein